VKKKEGTGGTRTHQETHRIKEWGSQGTNTYEKEKSQMAYDYGYDYSDEISLYN
jgi:hypothetical protein